MYIYALIIQCNLKNIGMTEQLLKMLLSLNIFKNSIEKLFKIQVFLMLHIPKKYTRNIGYSGNIIESFNDENGFIN